MCQKLKKWIVWLGLFIILFFATNNLDVQAEKLGIENLRVEITTKDDTFSYSIKCWQRLDSQSNEYYITLPYSAKNKPIKLYFEGPNIVYLDGEAVQNGMELDSLAEGENIICHLENTFSLYVIYGSDIPILYITTESGSMDKVYEDRNYKESGYAVVLEDDLVKYEGVLEHIKGRGNSSWQLDKKPFNIKFKDKKNLFDMGNSRKWALLANHFDNTSLKNKVGYDFAETVGIKHNLESKYVDLYIDSEYIGNYLLCEKVEIDEERIDITDLEKLNEIANPDINLEMLELGGLRERESVSVFGGYKWAELPDVPEVITGGYLLEMELESRYHKAVSGFVSEYGQPIAIKSPEYASKEQVEYIRNYYQEFENAVLNGDGYNEQGKHYSEYIDMESFAKIYLLQEFSKNLDGGGASLFFFKDVNGKLVASPVWDLDLAFGGSYEREGIRMDDPDGFWITISHLAGEELAEKYSILSLLCRHNDFREEAQQQWEECFRPNINDLLLNVDSIYKENEESIVADKFRWSIEGDYYLASENLIDSVNNLKDFIEKRSIFMSKIFSDESCYIEYNSNGGKGSMYDLEGYECGTKLRIQPNIYVNGDREFLGWNTKASGWGTEYADESEIILEEDITLYAQWKAMTFKERVQSFLLGIIGK